MLGAFLLCEAFLLEEVAFLLAVFSDFSAVAFFASCTSGSSGLVFCTGAFAGTSRGFVVSSLGASGTFSGALGAGAFTPGTSSFFALSSLAFFAAADASAFFFAASRAFFSEAAAAFLSLAAFFFCLGLCRSLGGCLGVLLRPERSLSSSVFGRNLVGFSLGRVLLGSHLRVLSRDARLLL